MGLDPPPITIVDPNAPAGTADLLDSGRDPWRPSTRQTAVAVTLLVVVGITAGVTAWVRHVRHEHALDRAAAAVYVQAYLEAIPLESRESEGGPFVQLSIGNIGLKEVRLVGLHLDGVAVPVSAGAQLLAGGATLPYPVPSAPCTRTSGRATRHDVAVELVTTRRQRLTRHVVLQGLGLDEANGAQRRECGTLFPQDALEASLVALHRSGDVVVATYDVRNISSLRVTLMGFASPPGLRVTARGLPVALVPEFGSTAFRPGPQVVVRLRVTDCQALARALADVQLGDDPGIDAVVHGELENGLAHIHLTQVLGDPYFTDPLSELIRSCPDLYAGPIQH